MHMPLRLLQKTHDAFAGMVSVGILWWARTHFLVPVFLLCHWDSFHLDPVAIGILVKIYLFLLLQSQSHLLGLVERLAWLRHGIGLVLCVKIPLENRRGIWVQSAQRTRSRNSCFDVLVPPHGCIVSGSLQLLLSAVLLLTDGQLISVHEVLTAFLGKVSLEDHGHL